MSISHVGHNRPLPLVSPQETSPKSKAVDVEAKLAERIENRKNLPEHAKGAAHGRSLEKHLAKWDRDGDGTLDVGPRFSQGLMGALLKLQETGAPPETAPSEVTEPTTPPVEASQPETPVEEVPVETAEAPETTETTSPPPPETTDTAASPPPETADTPTDTAVNEAALANQLLEEMASSQPAGVEPDPNELFESNAA